MGKHIHVLTIEPKFSVFLAIPSFIGKYEDRAEREGFIGKRGKVEATKRERQKPPKEIEREKTLWPPRENERK